jgi:hypothetical protein
MEHRKFSAIIILLKQINDILPCDQALSSNTLHKEWLPIAKNEKSWQHYIDEYFDSYQRIDESDDESVGGDVVPSDSSLEEPR